MLEILFMLVALLVSGLSFILCVGSVRYLKAMLRLSEALRQPARYAPSDLVYMLKPIWMWACWAMCSIWLPGGLAIPLIALSTMVFMRIQARPGLPYDALAVRSWPERLLWTSLVTALVMGLTGQTGLLLQMLPVTLLMVAFRQAMQFEDAQDGMGWTPLVYEYGQGYVTPPSSAVVTHITDEYDIRRDS